MNSKVLARTLIPLPPTSSASKTPFLLYMAFQHTHQPQFAGKMFTNTSIRGPFGDALSELDWAVGQVLEALAEEGIENDTLVFFTADNGYTICVCVCVMKLSNLEPQLSP